MSYSINMRSSMGPLTGVQRYAIEVAKRLDPKSERFIQPRKQLGSVAGQLWEQFVLPRRIAKGRLLWSPGNVGPLSVENQVITIHDASTLDHPEWFDHKFARWYRFALPRLARRVRGIVTVSQDSKERLLEHIGVPSDKIRVIHNGVSSDLSPSGAGEIEAMKGKYGMKGKYFAFVGSLEPRKNLSQLLEAWERCSDRLEGVELIIAGASGTVFSRGVESSVPNRCRFVGRMPEADLSAFISGSEALVYPSLYEGFGLPPLEAMACGTRVLSSNIAVIREVCGEDAMYFDPHCSESIADSLLAIGRESDCDRLERINAGRKRADSFTWERSAQSHKNYFEEIEGKIYEQ